MPVVFYVYKRPFPGCVVVGGGDCAVDGDSNILYNRMKHPIFVSGTGMLKVMQLPDQQVILGKDEKPNSKIHDCNHPAVACASCEYYQICDLPTKEEEHVIRPADVADVDPVNLRQKQKQEAG